MYLYVKMCKVGVHPNFAPTCTLDWVYVMAGPMPAIE